jgi:hypothetical protein
MTTIEAELIRDCVGITCLTLFLIMFYIILFTNYFNKK